MPFKNHSIRTGVCFGLTSATITTLGLMIGLYSSSNSKLIVLGGILTIAVADAFSDALGIHISEEAKDGSSGKEVWTSTFFTFISKFVFALTFAVPVLIFNLRLAIIVNIVWGLSVLSLLSYFIAKVQKNKALNVISEHLFISIVVIIATNFVGKYISKFFG